jgi:membrane fusion protein (multidrug efflux system)
LGYGAGRQNHKLVKAGSRAISGQSEVLQNGTGMIAGIVKKYGFAAVVIAIVGLMGLGVAGKALWGVAKPQSAAAPAASAAKGAGQAKGAGAAPILVVAAPVKSETFYDGLEAIGTAQARESITITAKVTDVIRAILFESGDRVTKGQVLVELANVEQAADLAEASASLEAEQREFERFRELGARGYAPAARVEEARAAYERAQARVNALRARIAERTIRAPFSGVMGLRTASPGALARPGEPIGTLDDVSSMRVDFDIAEGQLALVKAGAGIAATTVAFPGVEFEGKIETVDSRVNTQTRTLKVRAIMPNKDARLKPGMLLNVAVRANPRQALAAPEIAVVEREVGAFVFSVSERDGRMSAQQIAVETGARRAGLVEIKAGLAEGQAIIVEGVQRVRDGGAVRLEEAGAPSAKVEGRSPAAAPSN